MQEMIISDIPVPLFWKCKRSLSGCSICGIYGTIASNGGKTEESPGIYDQYRLCIIFDFTVTVLYWSKCRTYPISGNYMPFLSHGNMTMMITYFYMGILLSVYRNTNVVKN